MATETTTRADVVRTTSGLVQGTRIGSTLAFLGIPFAEPPFESRRFAAPVARRPWQGVRQANQHGPTPQRMPFAAITVIPEPSIPGLDTLNVNVFTPAVPSGSPLPVLVWIHGGGYIAGSPASPWYDGTSFNRDGVITVTVSYRLGIDGFGWMEDAPQNRGLLDCILGLQWVQKNIAAFGGDPKQVTLAGQSAGAGMVLTLMACPSAEHLFQRAISLSGALADIPLRTAQGTARAAARRAGISPTRAGFARLSEVELVDLQADTPAARSGLEAQVLARIGPLSTGALRWGPTVDGDLLPVPAFDALRDGVGRQIPLLIGATENEFDSAFKDSHVDHAGLCRQQALESVGFSSDGARVFLDERTSKPLEQILGEALTDRLFRAPAGAIAKARTLFDAETWLYRFSWTSPSAGEAFHCLDIPFFFDLLESEGVQRVTGTNPPTRLSRDLHGAAVSFIKGKSPGWPLHDGEVMRHFS